MKLGGLTVRIPITPSSFNNQKEQKQIHRIKQIQPQKEYHHRDYLIEQQNTQPQQDYIDNSNDNDAIDFNNQQQPFSWLNIMNTFFSQKINIDNVNDVPIWLHYDSNYLIEMIKSNTSSTNSVNTNIKKPKIQTPSSLKLQQNARYSNNNNNNNIQYNNNNIPTSDIKQGI
eukprot:UN03925